MTVETAAVLCKTNDVYSCEVVRRTDNNEDVLQRVDITTENIATWLEDATYHCQLHHADGV